MTINSYKNIETSKDDTKEAISKKDQDPKFFKQHMERLAWAIGEIDKLDPGTDCSMEKDLIQSKYSYVDHLQRMKEAQ